MQNSWRSQVTIFLWVMLTTVPIVLCPKKSDLLVLEVLNWDIGWADKSKLTAVPANTPIMGRLCVNSIRANSLPISEWDSRDFCHRGTIAVAGSIKQPDD